MPQRLVFGATLLLPKTVGNFTNPLRGILFVVDEPSTLDLREAFRIVFRHKSQDGLVAIDGHNDRMNGCPVRILPRCYFNAEGHSTRSTKPFMPRFVSIERSAPLPTCLVAIAQPDQGTVREASLGLWLSPKTTTTPKGNAVLVRRLRETGGIR